MNRDDVKKICQHSNLDEHQIKTVLENEILPDSESLLRFIRIVFLSLGVGFVLAGIIFFFAYNWQDLPKFLKFGMVEFLCIATNVLYTIKRNKQLLSKILIFSLAVLIGVLLAVFGQIYQTGANSYDLFRTWTEAILLLTIVSAFPPLWMFFIILLNITIGLYFENIYTGSTSSVIFYALFVLNLILFIISTLVNRFNCKFRFPSWFTKTLAVIFIFFMTISQIDSIFESSNSLHGIIVLSVVLVFLTGAFYFIYVKSIYHISLLMMSLLFIISSLIIENNEETSGFLLMLLFDIVSVSLSIIGIIHFSKIWTTDVKQGVIENFKNEK